jgi:hypothetical protein
MPGDQSWGMSAVDRKVYPFGQGEMFAHGLIHLTLATPMVTLSRQLPAF